MYIFYKVTSIEGAIADSRNRKLMHVLLSIMLANRLIQKKYKPWTLVWCASFSSEVQARGFERYLKTPSGHAFSRKRLI